MKTAKLRRKLELAEKKAQRELLRRLEERKERQAEKRATTKKYLEMFPDQDEITNKGLFGEFKPKGTLSRIDVLL